MHNTWHCRCDQPGQTKKWIDGNHDSRYACIIIVCISVFDHVRWVIDDVPRDTVVKKCQNKCQCSRTCRHKDYPTLAIQIKQINHPWSSTKGYFLFGTIIGEVTAAFRITTIECWCKAIWYIELFNRNIVKHNVLQKRKQTDTNRNSANQEIQFKGRKKFQRWEKRQDPPPQQPTNYTFTYAKSVTTDRM